MAIPSQKRKGRESGGVIVLSDFEYAMAFDGFGMHQPGCRGICIEKILVTLGFFVVSAIEWREGRGGTKAVVVGTRGCCGWGEVKAGIAVCGNCAVLGLIARR